jgi:tRNA modification GTPase
MVSKPERGALSEVASFSRVPADTIAAIASAPGGAHRAIVRMAGPDVVACLQRCFLPREGPPLVQVKRTMVIPGRLVLSDASGALPGDLYLWPTDRSYTRGPVAELHTIGSPPLVQAALRTVCASGARLAGPGEFTLRAFLAGRLDLPQAEAVLGVIDAASQRELEVALAQLAGGLSEPLNQLRDKLLGLLADLEAGFDFVEEDIQFLSPESLARQLREAFDVLDQVVTRMAARSVARDAARIVLAGAPNVGKSSLFNALVSRTAAVVTHVPGTTRDYLAARVVLEGMTGELIDTAGVDWLAANDTLGVAAQHMTSQQVEQAHLLLLCVEATRPLNDWERQRLAAPGPIPRLVVLTKSDQPCRCELSEPAIATSSLTGEGLDELRRRVVETLADRSDSESDLVSQTESRCGDSLRLARHCVRRAQKLVARAEGDELVAAEVRTALEELGQVVGAVYTDDLLDRIFSRFCIGK